MLQSDMRMVQCRMFKKACTVLICLTVVLLFGLIGANDFHDRMEELGHTYDKSL
jgi:hypothetical protein